MTTYNLFRGLYYIKELIIDHIKEHKTYYLIGFICFTLGFVTGVFSVVKYASLVELGDINDKVLIGFLKGDVTIFSLFFSRIISYMFLCLIIIVINAFIVLIPVNFIILTYKAFVTALTMGFIIVLYGFSGILLAIFVILPASIIFFIGLMSLISVLVERNLECKKFGISYFSDCKPYFPARAVTMVLLVILIAAIIELLLLPIISVTFVVII